GGGGPQKHSHQPPRWISPRSALSIYSCQHHSPLTCFMCTHTHTHTHTPTQKDLILISTLFHRPTEYHALTRSLSHSPEIAYHEMPKSVHFVYFKISAVSEAQ